MALWLTAIIKELTNSFHFSAEVSKNKAQICREEKIAGLLGTVGGLGTLLSGVLLVYFMGFANANGAIYSGLTIALVMSYIGAFKIGGYYHHLEKANKSGSTPDDLSKLATKLNRWACVMLPLWLSSFMLMGLRHFW
ncbi:hypothetical protein [Vibrio fortis]|uniref:hypothetical protein n=1 Tax=Vibrio fortis TaxID=212667 RepID=UPI0038CD4615